MIKNNYYFITEYRKYYLQFVVIITISQLLLSDGIEF